MSQAPATARRSARYSICYAPPPDDPWWDWGCRWLGRDAITGATREPPAVPGLGHEDWRRLTETPRRYGFHATLKAPFTLAPGRSEADLLEAAAAFARGRTPFAVERLRVAPLADFMALRPAGPCPAVEALAADCVRAFEPFRGPLDPAERARRHAAGLSAREAARLERWGYPYVMEAFRFHLTLTGPVAAGECGRVREMLDGLLGTLRERALTVDAVCVFVEPAPDAPLRVLARAGFDGRLTVYDAPAARGNGPPDG